MNKWKKWKINEICQDQSGFPMELKKISGCPKKLYYRGEWDTRLFAKTLSVVGSRRMTKYGREVIARFMPDLVANKVVIISGFMYGVDSEAHRTCLSLGGKTIAVLGCGLNCLTPIENDEMYAEILENGGLVVSEYEPDFKPTLWSFPQRNRIVSGMSTLGILIVEAGVKSGSLITARIGFKQKKNIFAVPGQITSTASEGSNWLIDQGLAKIAVSPGQILGQKNYVTQMDIFEENDINIEYKKVISVLRRESMTTDELAREINMNIPEISILISKMIMDGVIEDDNGKLYAL
ncbi:MAG: DNA-processing protein DprA [Candidatus Shapirobacteria bacterium]|jgi:DNA processing protein